jgi:uncharacterized protein
LTRIREINIYPVKSCKGISLNKAALTPTGFQHDRQFVLIDGDGQFLSQRRVPKMSRIETTLGEKLLWVMGYGRSGHCSIPLEGTKGDTRRVNIWGGEGTGIDMGDAAARWFSDYLEISCRLIRYDTREPRKRHSSVLDADVELLFADGYPVLIISEESLADLNRRLGNNPVKMNCFRPNIVIAGCSAPYAEDAWHIVQAGSGRLAGVKLCERCSIPMINQSTGTHNPKTMVQATGKQGIEPSATLATYRRLPSSPGKEAKAVVFGKNFIVLSPGMLRVGDLVATA